MTLRPDAAPAEALGVIATRPHNAAHAARLPTCKRKAAVTLPARPPVRAAAVHGDDDALPVHLFDPQPAGAPHGIAREGERPVCAVRHRVWKSGIHYTRGTACLAARGT